MLFKTAVLARIETGDVTCGFRRWKRPSVKAGSTLMTAVGVLAIEAVDLVDTDDITEGDATDAGYGSRAELLQALESPRGGSLYRIRFRWAGPDPREELRQRTDLSDDAWRELRGRLERLDSASPSGPWTQAVLELLLVNEGVRAGSLAPKLGREKEWFKLNVRKLKNLGLTESLGMGYRVSPRGRAILALLGSSNPPGQGS